MEKLRILFIEPFFGGSHRDFAEGLIKNSRHQIELFSLPSRFWKWRMRGAALHFSEIIKNPGDYDLLFTSDMMSLSDLKMLWGRDCPPSVVYFHENQLSYPLPEGEKMDYQFGFTDITTGLAADRLIFNSHFHMNSFFTEMPGFIKRMPEYKPLWAVERIRAKSVVIYPGCSFPFRQAAPVKPSAKVVVPVILWNHRWEFDKQPEVFFEALAEADRALKKRGIRVPFNLAILGENFQTRPKAFLKAEKRYGSRILQYGYCKNKADYTGWLSKADITVSTAIQENFGIATVEAIRAGCIPLLPDRLSYPELIPEKFHKDTIYSSDDELVTKLIETLQGLHDNKSAGIQPELAEYFSSCSWEKKAAEYDEMFLSVRESAVRR